MTKVRQKILVTLIVLFLAIPSMMVVWLAWTGFFTEVKVSEETLGPFVMVYEDHTGPYKQTEDIMERVSEQLLEQDNIKTNQGFVIYCDEQKETPQDSLRSKAGRIIESPDTTKIRSSNSRFKIMRLPAKRYVVAKIANRGALSAFAGSVKVYPALNRFMKENGYSFTKAMEIYDRNKTIIYLKEIKQ